MTRATGPHRNLKVERLRSAVEVIPQFAARTPRKDDPEFTQWSKGVTQLLRDLFVEPDMLGYMGRFVKIRFRATIADRAGNQSFQPDYRAVWARGLQEADVVLREALGEAELGLPVSHESPSPSIAGREQPIVINVTNAVTNSFSPTVQVTFTQIVAELDKLVLTPAEREAARSELVAIDEETRGEQRWPLIARSLETLKALGKGVYKEVAIPLVVEFLKHQAGLKPPHQ